MSIRIKIDTEMLSVMTDDDIRTWLMKNAAQNNYSYVTKVCRKCGSFYMDENGDSRTAKIVDVCRHCIEIPEKENKT